MQHIFQNAKRLISICLVTLLLVNSILVSFPAPARAAENPVPSNISTTQCSSMGKQMQEPPKTSSENATPLNEDVLAVGSIAAASSAAASLGSITVATVTSAVPGILGWVGLTTTTVVALPAAGIVAGAGLVGYGVYKGIQLAQGGNSCQSSSDVQ
jgi:hypothetical protein